MKLRGLVSGVCSSGQICKLFVKMGCVHIEAGSFYPFFFFTSGSAYFLYFLVSHASVSVCIISNLVYYGGSIFFEHPTR